MPIQNLTLSIPALLLAQVAIPRLLANTRSTAVRSAVTAAIGLQLLVAAGCFCWHLLQPQTGLPAIESSFADQIGASIVHYDTISGLMFLLVSFVGLVVSKFSVRYLDGDEKQGGYFQWLGFTLGAVSLLVLAGNLVLFFIAWVLTSLGLHHLLLHFKERPWASRAAWTKFAISRVGDLFLLAAMILVYREFGTYQLANILEQAKQITEPSWQLSFVAWFLMLGAAIKSAQFPVHFWLPETMEAPTPVSALMHAGIVNAGGYLLVRWSPLLVHAPGAMATLAVIGGFTAVFASLVMMTQANVKRSLGYSTVAQMGFMMLQCGLGAFSAAMLHIVAHSLYKAHAFLRSGDAWRVEQAPALSEDSSGKVTGHLKNHTLLGFALLLAAGIVTFVANGLAFDLTSKAGGLTLGAISCLALASWFAQAYVTSWRALGYTAFTAVLMISTYLVSYFMIDSLISRHLPEVLNGALLGIVGTSLIALFVALAALQALVPQATQHRLMQVLYVHVSNGLYVDTIVRRLLGLSLSRSPSAS